MQAVVKTRPGVGIEVMDMPVPKIKPNECLIEVEACGICGTDIKIYKWSESKANRPGKAISFPVILGHEAAGVVVEVGPEVKNFKPGDRVVSDTHGGCGFCYWCRSGFFNLCSEKANAVLGEMANGAFAKYCAIPFFTLYKIPKSVSFEEAAVLEPLGVALRGFETLVRFNPGDTVAVLGCGPIGLLDAMVAKAGGAVKVFVIGRTRNAKRLELARQLGFTVINSDERPARDVIFEATDGLGVDVVFDATSLGDPGSAIKLLNATGQMVMTALPEGKVTFDGADFKGEKIITHDTGRLPTTYRRVIELVASGQIDVKPLITHRFGVEQAELAFQTLMRSEGMKALIVP
ncbi:MAG: alcohol dehydrogenase catalytic domain-containing protein [Chloroflexi bacterium]|nr:alcohol dehydrogenase catalytic domain-containing protein [Chloroflexota bacterium]